MKKLHILATISLAAVLLAGCTETTAPSDSTGNNPNNGVVSQSSSQSGSDSSQAEPENQNITVSNGDVLEISDNISCSAENEIRIEKGGTLDLSGEIDLSGDLYVEGKLHIAQNAKIGGTGVIHVVNSFDDIECEGTVTAKIDAPEPVEIDGVTYVGGILLVNKEYGLPREFGTDIADIRPELRSAIEQMRADTGFGMTLRPSSGYRSYATQEWWFNYYCDTDGYDNAITYSALPGHSEHQTGYAADITKTELD